ncbi:MAG: carboxymuconolactone decarboxylase family protein [Thermoplasmata archaeon]|nr:MAG: carboxymuconolactone decarboxylase family protein [Thermoplasmata archaeon]
MKELDEYMKEREKLDEIVMEYANLNIKRFYNLDSRVYHKGVIPAKYKEMMGLVASMVLRCEGCIKYHIRQCHDKGINDEEFVEAMAIALIVGGSIVIPHLRDAFKAWNELKN